MDPAGQGDAVAFKPVALNFWDELYTNNIGSRQSKSLLRQTNKSTHISTEFGAKGGGSAQKSK